MVRSLLGTLVEDEVLVPGGAIVGKVKDMSINEATQFMNMDADTIGHYLCVLADWHSVLDQRIRDQKYVVTEMQMTDLYLLGNIEGRLLHGFTTAVDIEMIEDWEREVPIRWNEGVGEF